MYGCRVRSGWDVIGKVERVEKLAIPQTYLDTRELDLIIPRSADSHDCTNFIPAK